MRQVLWNVLRGFFMGAADIVPGVSGGTMALVLGIYERLIGSVRSGSSALGAIVRADVSGFVEWMRKVEWTLILPLVGGIGLAVAALSHLIETQLETSPIQLAALFLGLVAGSVVISWNLVKTPHRRLVLVMAVTAVVAFVLLGVRTGTDEASVTQVVAPSMLAFFVAGAIAICAMILPGVSGSFLLVLLGMYAPVLGAVNDRDIGTVLVFVAGTIVGLALFSQVLYRALDRAHDVVIAVLIGLMLGSVRVLWPWPDGVNSTMLSAPDEHIWAAIGLAVVGFSAVIAIGTWSQRVARTNETMAAEADRTSLH